MPIRRRIGHRKNRLIAAVGLVAVLAACGAATANQPAAESTGDGQAVEGGDVEHLDVAGNLS